MTGQSSVTDLISVRTFWPVIRNNIKLFTPHSVIFSSVCPWKPMTMTHTHTAVCHQWTYNCRNFPTSTEHSRILKRDPARVRRIETCSSWLTTPFLHHINTLFHIPHQNVLDHHQRNWPQIFESIHVRSLCLHREPLVVVVTTIVHTTLVLSNFTISPGDREILSLLNLYVFLWGHVQSVCFSYALTITMYSHSKHILNVKFTPWTLSSEA